MHHVGVCVDSWDDGLPVDDHLHGWLFLRIKTQLYLVEATADDYYSALSLYPFEVLGESIDYLFVPSNQVASFKLPTIPKPLRHNIFRAENLIDSPLLFSDIFEFLRYFFINLFSNLGKLLTTYQTFQYLSHLPHGDQILHFVIQLPHPLFCFLGFLINQLLHLCHLRAQVIDFGAIAQT